MANLLATLASLALVYGSIGGAEAAMSRWATPEARGEAWGVAADGAVEPSLEDDRLAGK